MLTTAKPYELKPFEVIVHNRDHYTVTKVTLHRPYQGWTTIHAVDRDGLIIKMMFDSNTDINVVRTRGYSPQRESAQRKDAACRSRRVPGSSR